MRERIDLMRHPGNREVISRIIHDYERLGCRAHEIAKRGANDNAGSESLEALQRIGLEVSQHFQPR